ncbi:MAG: M48 family metallopeptidase [Tannerella sp.]|nr:M48 family metallopeptidase [Tannerella sp.]
MDNKNGTGTDKTVHDESLGEIVLRRHARSHSYTLRIGNGQVIAVMPLHGDEQFMMDFIDRKRTELLLQLRRSPVRPRWDETVALQTYTFRVHIFRTDRANFYAALKEGVLHVACPEKTDFQREEVQQCLRKMVEQALRHEARRMLPPRLRMLAEKHGFRYADASIRHTQSRWGSCSATQHIHLSLSLMLLPEHLIDYVLLHELCHTVEMNHGKRFYELLNSVTGGQALALRRELKAYRML